MRRLLYFLITILLATSNPAFSQSGDSTEVFLITCHPGNEVATVYGHSAIRILRTSIGFDQVYSWGVYDFSTPHFAWKFAQGRLNYSIDNNSFGGFIEEYITEQRSVISQKINLSTSEKDTLISLINYNLRPENRLYLYDFFYDNCATRIRDIIESTKGKRLAYPDEKNLDHPTFRERINEVQQPIQWLSVGTDLLIGKSGDKEAGFRERMFLPADLMKNLSLANTIENGKMIPLLQKPVMVLDFPPIQIKNPIWFSPLFVMSIILIIILLLPIVIKWKHTSDYMDKILFFIFSVLSILMVFFNFFTDHQAMKTNLNIIWLNPVLILAFASLFSKSPRSIWFRTVFITSSLFLLSASFIPQSINIAFIPAILIVTIRSAVRSRLPLRQHR